MRAIEKNTIITSDGKLPSSFREAFGKKAKVIVLFNEGGKEESEHEGEKSEGLMDLAGKIKSFDNVEDPVVYQRRIREEWDRDWK